MSHARFLRVHILRVFKLRVICTVCSIQCSDSRIFILSFPIYIFTELLFELFEPLSTSHSMQYDNGQDWEDMRKWLYEYPIPVYYLQMILKFLVILKDNDTCKLQQDNVKYH